MSAAVTVPGPCLRRYIVTGSSISQGTTRCLMVRDRAGEAFLDPGDGRELVEHAVDPDRGDGRARDGRQERPAQRVAEGVAEARLERLDEEPRAVLVDDLLGEGGALCDEHVYYLQCQGRPLFTGHSCGAPARESP